MSTDSEIVSGTPSHTTTSLAHAECSRRGSRRGRRRLRDRPLQTMDLDTTTQRRRYGGI